MNWLLIMALLFVAASYLAARVERGVKRRGCGRGCATCGNREHCHRTLGRRQK